MPRASALTASPLSVAPNSMIAATLLVRIDDGALDPSLRARIVRLLDATMQDADRLFTCDARTIAVVLSERDSADAEFLAERIRLMVAAMPAALPAPTVTVAIANANQLRDHARAAMDAMSHGRNRVIRISGVR